ncbi:hypothetical protein BC829DRAFT_1023 [Chytridium lagenaria]|nr:hypothetical protein BC829DRAFT_1023 [Chytridium lagenaria]
MWTSMHPHQNIEEEVHTETEISAPSFSITSAEERQREREPVRREMERNPPPSSSRRRDGRLDGREVEYRRSRGDSRSRSPPARGGHRSRSPARERRRQASPSDDERDGRGREVGRRRQDRGRGQERSMRQDKEVAEEGEAMEEGEEEVDEEEAMRRMLGFGSFETTKQKKVSGNVNGAVNVAKRGRTGNT